MIDEMKTAAMAERVARGVRGAGKGTLSFNGRFWTLRWTTGWPDTDNGGAILDRELMAAAVQLKKDAEASVPTMVKVEVKTDGYECGRSGLLGVVLMWLREGGGAWLPGDTPFHSEMKRRGYRLG